MNSKAQVLALRHKQKKDCEEDSEVRGLVIGAPKLQKDQGLGFRAWSLRFRAQGICMAQRNKRSRFRLHLFYVGFPETFLESKECPMSQMAHLQYILRDAPVRVKELQRQATAVRIFQSLRYLWAGF